MDKIFAKESKWQNWQKFSPGKNFWLYCTLFPISSLLGIGGYNKNFNKSLYLTGFHYQQSAVDSYQLKILATGSPQSCSEYYYLQEPTQTIPRLVQICYYLLNVN